MCSQFSFKLISAFQLVNINRHAIIAKIGFHLEEQKSKMKKMVEYYNGSSKIDDLTV